jgi:hypothetical protein
VFSGFFGGSVPRFPAAFLEGFGNLMMPNVVKNRSRI